jgi:hypothetical protein
MGRHVPEVQVAHVLAAFYIPDHLAGGPLTAAELAHLAGLMRFASQQPCHMQLLKRAVLNSSWLSRLRHPLSICRSPTHENYHRQIRNTIDRQANQFVVHTVNGVGVKSEDGLWRVLRLAVVQGQLNGETDRAGATRFYNNRLSATLRSDHPNSVR